MMLALHKTWGGILELTQGHEITLIFSRLEICCFQASNTIDSTSVGRSPFLFQSL